MPSPLTDLSRLSIHTMTNKPWSLRQCIDGYTRAGIGGISVWRNVIEPIGAAEASRMLRDSPLKVVSLVRSGFFPGLQAAQRQQAIDDNRRAIDDAATIGAEMVVLVCGAVPRLPLEESRKQIADGVARILPHAADRKVKLAIEPLHPMYAADRSAINRLAEARKLCEALPSPWLGIAADVYHIWWDPDLETEIQLAGRNKRLFAFHVCDWLVNTRDLLNDRGIMGDGCIPLPHIRGIIEAAGFDGFHEAEIFSAEQWTSDQSSYVTRIAQSYLQSC
jgi:sugar phosphate isomerase/epimerase